MASEYLEKSLRAFDEVRSDIDLRLHDMEAHVDALIHLAPGDLEEFYNRLGERLDRRRIRIQKESEIWRRLK